MSVEADAGLAFDEERSPEQRSRFLHAAALRLAGKIAVSLVLLIWIYLKVRHSGAALEIGGWGSILAVWLMQSALPFVQAERWRLIAATLSPKPPFSLAIGNVYVGQFFNQVLPSAIGGDAVRVWRLTRFMSAEAALSSVALDRIVALIAVPIILILGAGLLARIVPPGSFRLGLYAMMLMASAGMVLLVIADRIPLPAALLRLRVVEVLRAVPVAARGLFRRPACLLRTLALSMVIHAGVGTSLWLLARDFVPAAPLSAFLLLAPVVTLVTTVPISLGGWGVREGAMVTALGLVGIAPSVALAVSIEFGLIMLVVGLPGGVLAFVGQPRSQAPGETEAPGAERLTR